MPRPFRAAPFVAVALIAAACSAAGGSQPAHTAASPSTDAGQELPALNVSASVPGIAFPIALVDTGDAIWALGHENATWTRIDPATSTVTDTIGIGGPSATGGVLAGGKLWALDMADQAVVGVDPVTKKVAATVPVGIDGGWVVGEDQLLYAVGNDASTAQKIDPKTHKVTSLPIDAGCGSTPAVGGGFLWMVSGDGRLCKLDPATGNVLASLDGLGATGWLGYAADRVLVPALDGGMSVVDPATMTLVGTAAAPPMGTFHGERYTLGAPENAVGILGDGPSAWVRYYGATVGHLDLAGAPAWTVYAGLPAGHDGLGMAKADGSMWFSDAGGSTVVRTAIP